MLHDLAEVDALLFIRFYQGGEQEVMKENLYVVAF